MSRPVSPNPGGAIERRVARLARQSARVVLELRREGDAAGASRFEAAAIEAVERVRRGAL